MIKRYVPILLFIFGFLLYGCAPLLENMPGFAHTAVLIVGNDKASVISQAESLCGEPKVVAYADKDTSDEIETRRYNFTTVYDLVLYFHKKYVLSGRADGT